jgi:hypothetical protein
VQVRLGARARRSESQVGRVELEHAARVARGVRPQQRAVRCRKK